MTSRFPIGTNAFEREWDALLILDTCRVDAMREVADEYNFIGSVESMTSVGSSSFEWMNNTFRTRYKPQIRNTAYLSQNSFVDQTFGKGGTTGKASIPFEPSRFDVVELEDFAYIEHLWQAEFDDASEWTVSGEAVSRTSPRYTTERAIEAGRTRDPDRLIVHYMYPHDPYVLADEKLQPRFDTALKSGAATREEVWAAYLDNLRFVLDQVEVLLKNLDRERVAITADHGEAFGEYMFYRHPPACPIPSVRKVPWVETTGTDERTVEPTAPSPSDSNRNATAEERLQQLGYL
ncbi:hypothetical protein [Halorubrum trueperi]|uniref:Sulfatase N-terminal domain-containing protein n=1 Tax=Halorubrum trueperi TaxID=2004704 RepID=A0ABD5USD7_9EURY